MVGMFIYLCYYWAKLMEQKLPSSSAPFLLIKMNQSGFFSQIMVVLVNHADEGTLAGLIDSGFPNSEVYFLFFYFQSCYKQNIDLFMSNSLADLFSSKNMTFKFLPEHFSPKD